MSDITENTTGKTGYVVPSDINVALLHTVIAVTALRDVMIRENEALDMHNTQAFLQIQDEKVDAARRYDMLVCNLMARKDEVKSAAQNLRDQLDRLQGDFSKTAAANAEKLDRMKNATKRLADFIMTSARKAAEAQSQYAYGAQGKFYSAGKASIGYSERA